MAHQIVDYLKKDCFNCAVCIDKLKDPKMLPCAHTFCSNCLETVFSGSRSLTCPTCRKATVLPMGGVGGLPSSFLVKNLMEKVDVAEEFKFSPSSCNSCQGMTDIHFCLDCKLNVCSRCKTFHDKIPGTTDHITVAIERLVDEEYMKKIQASYVPRCDKHKEEKCVFFCTSCRKPSCRDCKILDHCDHHVVTAEEGHSSTRNKLQSLLKLAVDEKKSMEQTAENIHSLIDCVDSRVATVKEQVDTVYKTVVERCQADKEKLFDEISKREREHRTPLEEISAEVRQWASEMKTALELAEGTLDENIKWNMLREGNELVDTLRKLSEDERRLGSPRADPDAESFSFMASLESMSSVNLLGRIRDTDTTFINPNRLANLDGKPTISGKEDNDVKNPSTRKCQTGFPLTLAPSQGKWEGLMSGSSHGALLESGFKGPSNKPLNSLEWGARNERGGAVGIDRPNVLGTSAAWSYGYGAFSPQPLVFGSGVKPSEARVTRPKPARKK